MENSQLDLAWSAGFFDGEGCIVVGKTTNSLYRHGVRYQPRISVTQVNIRPLQKLKSFFGGSINKNKRPNGKICYMWVATSITAFKFLIKVKPYLINKKLEAATLINSFRIFHPNGRFISDQNFKKREEVYLKLRYIKDIIYDRD